MNASILIYMAFFCLGTAVFAWLRPAGAVATVYIGGLLFLPVAHYVSSDFADASTHTVLSTALPAYHLINKSWVAALTAACGAVLFDRASVARFRPSLADLPMAVWCGWPLAQSLFVDANPSPWMASLYLAASWGLPWALGRIYFRDPQQRLILFDTMTGISLLLLPIAVIEGIYGLRIYEWLYGPHPFAGVGAIRYIGYRPLAMFEDGNQYGLWIACIAVIAVWRARTVPAESNCGLRTLIAVLFCLASLASQSIGAIILMAGGVAFIFLSRRIRSLHRFIIPAAIAISLGFCVYVSGVLPLRTIAKETVAGQTVLAVLKKSDRSSLSWRVSQDEKVMPVVRKNLLIGSGHWDWWRDTGTRPWGLPLLLIGQFGLVGLLLAIASPIVTLWRGWPLARLPQGARSSLEQQSNFLLSVILIMAACDAMLNAFVFLPAILFAGSFRRI